MIGEFCGMNAVLHVTLLGSLSARTDERSASPGMSRFRTQKTASLFAFLAYRAGTPQPREELIDRFWPESDVDAARASLRTALASLRKDFGDFLQADKAFVMLSARTDLQRFEAAIRAARSDSLTERQRIERLREATEAYGGPLLPGQYDDWVLAERSRLEAEHRAALSGLSRWHAAMGELHVAVDYAHRASASDPFSEELRADLIRLLKQAGRPGEARRQYEELERLFQEQLGENPSSGVRALVADIAEVAEVTSPEPARAVHLPPSRGRFRGRRESLHALSERIAGASREAESGRLFTLFGPGGIGKTRLAIETARRLASQGLIEEVWFVPLDTANTEDQVWEAILEALGLTRSATTPAICQISPRLSRAGSSLLVLDNLEQVTLDAGGVAARLLDECAGLTVLATSRRRLGVPAEEIIPVAGLEEDDSVGLYIDRARAVDGGFSPSDAERSSIRALVERLEGFPLAIELAAAWSSVLSPEEILGQVENGILALPARASDDSRHASLAAAIRWSVELLGADLRRAFFALSIFRGGWDARAAESVCEVEKDALASLRDRSLITALPDRQRIRFGMHEALREFGEAALTPSERESLAYRHAEYFLTLSESEPQWRLIAEHANARAALAAANELQSRRFGLALASFWDKQGHWREGRSALETVTAGDDPAFPLQERAEMLHSLGRLCYNLCDFEASRIHHEKSLDIFRGLDDNRGMARAFHALASLAFHHKPDIARSRELSELALQHFLLAGDSAGQCAALIGLAVIATGEADYPAARSFQQRSLEIAEAALLPTEAAIAHWRLGLTATLMAEYDESDRQLVLAESQFEELHERINQAYVRVERGVLAQNRGDFETARLRYAAALPLFREIGESWACAICLGNLARLAANAGDFRLAATHWRESLDLRVHLHDDVSITAALDGIAALMFRVADATADAEMGRGAIRLRSAAARLRMNIGVGVLEDEDRPAQEQAVRTRIGSSDCDDAEASGSAMSRDESVALAMTTLETISR